jgi:Helix-turn-helix domain
MKTISKDTKTFKLFTALKAGQKITASQAEKRFGIKNLAAEASRIRQHGYAVYANSRTSGNGVTVTEYEMGRPSREIVALGYLAKNLGLTV